MFRFFENLVDPFAAYDETTPPKDLWPYLRSQYAPFKKLMIAMMISGFLVGLIEVGLIFYTGHVIDLINETPPGKFWSRHWLELIFAVLFILVLRPANLAVNKLLIEQGFAGNMQTQVIWRSHKQLLGQSTGFFQNDFAGRLANRVMQLRAAVEDMTFIFFEGIWYALIYVAGAVIILSQMDYRLGLPLVIWMLFYVTYVRIVARRVAAKSEKLSDKRSLVTGRIVDAYSNIESVKLFAHGGSEEKYAKTALRGYRLRFLQFVRLMITMSLGLNFLNGVLLVGVVGMAIWLWSIGEVSIGQVAAATALSLQLNNMSRWVMWLSIRIFEHIGVIRESLRSISVPHAVTDKPDAPALKISKGEIEFRDAEQGQILIDGQNVADVAQDSLRRAIGMVTQDSSLLHRSVRDNILYGRPDADPAQMIAAARRAEADEFIQGLVDPQGRSGYEAQVGERGVKLSGGATPSHRHCPRDAERRADFGAGRGYIGAG